MTKSIVSYTSIDVGFDLRRHNMKIVLPNAITGVRFDSGFGDETQTKTVEGSREDLTKALREAGYKVCLGSYPRVRLDEQEVDLLTHDFFQVGPLMVRHSLSEHIRKALTDGERALTTVLESMSEIVHEQRQESKSPADQKNLKTIGDLLARARAHARKAGL
jgi:hypothetical protein